MHILISPAKNLDFETQSPIKKYSEPKFLDEAEDLVRTCRKLSTTKLSELMGISEKLALLNKGRFAEWDYINSDELLNALTKVFAKMKNQNFSGLESHASTAKTRLISKAICLIKK